MKTLDEMKLLFNVGNEGWRFYYMPHADAYTAIERASNSVTSDCQALTAGEMLYIATLGACNDPDATEVVA